MLKKNTATVLAEIDTVTELMRNNARKLIRSTIANQQSQEETTPSVAASSDGAARHIDFTQKPQAGKGTHHQDEGVIHLNVNGMQWPPHAGARGGDVQSYRDPFFSEPLYQQAFGLHQELDNQTRLMIKEREVLGEVTKNLLHYESVHNDVYEESMINIIITFFETSDHTDAEILALMTHDLGLKYSDAPMWKPSEGCPLERMKILAATQCMDDLLWAYLRNIMLNVDGVRCAIFMMPADATSEINLYYRGQLTRAGRRQYTAADFPLNVEAHMQDRNVNLCVRTTMRGAWYK